MIALQSGWLAFARFVTPTAWHISAELPFTFSQDRHLLTWECVSSQLDGDQLIEIFHSDDNTLTLTADYCRYADPHALTVGLTLTNNTALPSAPFSRIEPLRFGWEAASLPAYARTVGGGVNEKVYPPHAFRLDTLRLDEGGGLWSECGWDGRSSNKDIPLFVVSAGEEILVAGLEWSGYWWGSVSGPNATRYQVQIHIPVNGMRLQAGETLTLPTAHYIFADGALDGASNACRRYLNAHILPPLDGKPITPTVNYNHWFGLGPDIDEARMVAMVALAARTGAEYFVLDAGWYAGCRGNDFECGVGNLELVDTTKFPRGLQPLAAHVRAHGMEFGLWFELERAHRESDWVRRHPEWFIDIGADYLHLDLSRRDAQDGCIAIMTGAATALGLRWLKLDYNAGPRPYWEHTDPTGKIQFSYLQGLYRVLDAVVAECPDLIMECCASGGRRIDLAMLKRAHEAWISDESLSSENVRFMQIGANYLLPGQLNNTCLPFGRHEGSTTCTDYDIACRMTGSLAFHGDLAVLDTDALDRLGRMAEIFKSYRHLLREDFYPLLPQPRTDSDWEAVLFCSYDARETVVFVFSGREVMVDNQRRIRLKGLCADTHYHANPLGGTSQYSMTGKQLMHDGLVVQLGARAYAAWHLIAMEQ